MKRPHTVRMFTPFVKPVRGQPYSLPILDGLQREADARTRALAHRMRVKSLRRDGTYSGDSGIISGRKASPGPNRL